MNTVNTARYKAWKQKRRRRIIRRVAVRIILLLVILSGLVVGVRSFNRDDENDYPVNGGTYIDNTQNTNTDNSTEETDESASDRIGESIEFCGSADPENAVVITDEQAMSYLALINNCYRVSRDFTPWDLSQVNVESMHAPTGVHLLRGTAARATEQLFQAAATDGVFLILTSGYRSYDSQMMFHTNAIRDFGPEEGRRRSAVPGHSEHQLGLALDLSTHELSGDLVQTFAETPEGIWVSQNAHRFGFIQSFPYGREEDTGIMYEPWHIRYVGVEAATEIFNAGQILEEFLWHYDD